MKKIITIVILLICLGWTDQHLIKAENIAPSYTPYFPNYPPLTPKEMMEFAQRGAKFLEDGGDIQEFNNIPGKFTKGEFMDYRYLAIGDCKTKTVLAHPFIPKIHNVKGLMIIVKDANGRVYSAEVCDAAMKNPKGAWLISYVYKIPGESQIDLLYQYYLRVKRTNLAVAVFSRQLKIESHLEKRAKAEEKILNALVK